MQLTSQRKKDGSAKRALRAPNMSIPGMYGSFDRQKCIDSTADGQNRTGQKGLSLYDTQYRAVLLA